MVYQGSEYEEYIPHKHHWNEPILKIKLHHIAEVICDVDADIIGLQEIENQRILTKLSKTLQSVGCPYAYSAITHKKGASIQVAILSRFPLKKHKDIKVSNTPKVRNILEVEASIEGQVLTLFVNHWKSLAYQGYESKRIVYAKALMKRIKTLSSSQEYIIIGDLNSDYNAYLTLAKKLDDSHGKTALNDILKTKISDRLVSEKDMLSSLEGIHYDLWNELKVSKRWSYRYYTKKSSLDHIVLEAKMFDGKGIDYVNNSFKVYKAGYLFTKKGYINRWKYKRKKHIGKGYSDHLPLVASFDTKAYHAESYQPKPKQDINKSIASLYKVESLEYPIELHDVVVILKRGRNAIIKHHLHGRGILLYGCASGLKMGHKYDIYVEAIKSYHGLKEITHAYILKEKGLLYLDTYYKKQPYLLTKSIQQNEVIRDIKGIYNNHSLLVDGHKIPIYFKKKKLTPKNGTQIKIDYAHVGYYNTLQLVIYSKKDFEIVEK
jgi:endonuclease/exonuclease/phosphatase family metal-dependent hydrolase